MKTRRALCTALLAIGALVAIVGTSAAARPARSGALVPAGALRLGNEITVAAANDVAWEPAAAYNWKHSEYLVVWRNAAGVYGQRVTRQGELIGPSPFPIAEGSKERREPAVDYDPVNDRYFVVWMHDHVGDGSDWDLSGRFIPWEGSTGTLPEFKVTDWPGDEWHPSVAYSRGKQEFLVVFVYHPDLPMPPPAYIAGVRVVAAGGFNGSVNVASSLTEVRDFPDVAYSGVTRNEYLVAFNVWKGATGYDIYAVRLDNNGAPLGGGEFPVATATQLDSFPAVAGCNDADQYLVTWDRFVSGGDHGVFGKFITGTGVADVSELTVANTTAWEQLPDVACSRSGKDYLVAWDQQYAGGDRGIWARPIGADKTMGKGVALVHPFGTFDRTSPAVTGGAPHYLVAWEHQRPGTGYQDIHGRLAAPYAVYLPLVIAED